MQNTSNTNSERKQGVKQEYYEFTVIYVNWCNNLPGI